QFQALMDLHVRTFQDLRYLKPEDLSDLRQPGEMLNKHMALTIENGQKIFDYMQKSFQLMGTAFLSFSKDIKENTEQSIKQAKGISVSIQKQRKPSERKKATKTLLKSQAAKPEAKKAVSKNKPTKVSKPVSKKSKIK